MRLTMQFELHAYLDKKNKAFVEYERTVLKFKYASLANRSLKCPSIEKHQGQIRIF